MYRAQSVTPFALLLQAINSCYISVKQLIYEVIHICQKYQLEDTPVTKLIPLEEVIRTVVK